MKRMIRILAVAVLVAVILVASISPALARPRHLAITGEDHSGDPHPSCVATENAQNERGAQHVISQRLPSVSRMLGGATQPPR